MALKGGKGIFIYDRGNRDMLASLIFPIKTV